MKVELYYDDHGWDSHLEPESEVEKCALDYLAGRPNKQVCITITRLGLFKREGEDGTKDN